MNDSWKPKTNRIKFVKRPFCTKRFTSGYATQLGSRGGCANEEVIFSPRVSSRFKLITQSREADQFCYKLHMGVNWAEAVSLESEH